MQASKHHMWCLCILLWISKALAHASFDFCCYFFDHNDNNRNWLSHAVYSTLDCNRVSGINSQAYIYWQKCRTATSMNMGPPASASASAGKTSSIQASITPSPTSKLAPALAKRDFTMPDFLEPWYYYGRIDPACSCIIKSANPPLHFSASKTDTVYNTTVVSLYGHLISLLGAY